MKFAIHRLGLVIGLSACIGWPLHACAELSPQPAAKGSMSSNPAKKNGSGVDVQYRVEGSPVIGAPVVVTLRLGGVTSPLGATVRVVADGGLSVSGDSSFPVLRAGEQTTFSVNVVPGSDVGYLHVFTVQDGQTSVTSVPVQVAGAAAKLPAAGSLKNSTGGDKILSLPVK